MRVDLKKVGRKPLFLLRRRRHGRRHAWHGVPLLPAVSWVQHAPLARPLLVLVRSIRLVAVPVEILRLISGCDRRERTVPSVLYGQSVLFYHYRYCQAGLEIWRLGQVNFVIAHTYIGHICAFHTQTQNTHQTRHQSLVACSLPKTMSAAHYLLIWFPSHAARMAT